MVSSGIGPRDKEVGFLAHLFLQAEKMTHLRTSARQSELVTFLQVGWKNSFLGLTMRVGRTWRIEIGGDNKTRGD